MNLDASVIEQNDAPGPQDDKHWHAQTSAQVLESFQTTSARGLTAETANQRLEQYGLNELVEAKRTTIWQMLWQQFNNFVVILLIVAAIVSAILGDYPEAAAIMAIVVLNAIMGVIQEYNAERSLAALKKLAAPEAHVVRDGRRESLPARFLVPGDIILLEAGNYVPADVRLIEAMNLRVEEAPLTGESVPVEKNPDLILENKSSLGDRKNMAFMGTVVSYGRGRAVVVDTGMQTQIGRIAEMIQSVEDEQTPLQKRLDQLGRTLGIAALVVCALVFVVGWLKGNSPLEMFIVAVSNCCGARRSASRGDDQPGAGHARND
jgi:Ca2+-transporting ATPase